jgi:hypothetical protein
MMPMRFLILLFLMQIGAMRLLAVPEDMNFPSPDGRWAVEGHWIGDKGYAYKVEELKSHKSFLDYGPVPDDEVLPVRLDAIWSPDSRYVALTEYYGRAMQELEVFALTGPVPKGIELKLVSGKLPLEETLLHPEDVPKYDGYNRLLTGAVSWLNARDLVVGIDARIFLKDTKTGAASILDTSWQKTVRCTPMGGSVISSECQDYTIENSSR